MSRYSLNSADSTISDYNKKTAFRVSVCLKRFFKDFRCRCYILIKINHRVRWLEKRLQNIFAIPGTFCLCTNGHFLPSSEYLALLAPGDTLEVIPINEDIKMPQYKSSTSSNVNNKLEIINKGTDLTKLQSCRNNCYPTVDHNQITLNKLNEENKQNNNTSEDDSDVSTLISKDNIDGKIDTNKVQCNVDTNSNLNNKQSKVHVGTNDTSYNLQELKQHALALLDSQCSAQGGSEAELEEPPLKKTRRRVRRRTRRSHHGECATGLEAQDQPQALAETLVPISPRLSTERQVTDVALSLVEDNLSSVPPEVARNEAVSSRKPRVVRPLGVE